MSNTENDMSAAYDALRCDLIHLLMKHRSQGRFTLAAEGFLTPALTAILPYCVKEVLADPTAVAELKVKQISDFDE